MAEKVGTMKFPLRVAYALTLAASVLAVPGAAAQVPEDDDAPRFVVRISRPFLAQLTEKQFAREEPVHDVILGATVEGMARTDGRFSVKLQQDKKIDNFLLVVRGQVLSRTIARRGRIAIHSEGQARYSAVRPVLFTGNEFVGQPVEVEVAFHSRLDGITTRRDGPFSRLASRIARPSVVRSMPEGDRISESKLRDHLGAALTRDSDEMLVALNRVTGVATTLVLLQKVWSPSATDLPIQLAVSDQYLLMGMAAHEQSLPELPVLSEQDRAPMEVWVRRLAKKNELNPVPGLRIYWLALGSVLKTHLSTATDLAEALDYVHVTELEDWRVVRLYLDRVKNQPAPRTVNASHNSQALSIESKFRGNGEGERRR